jgi:hypothetical protein
MRREMKFAYLIFVSWSLLFFSKLYSEPYVEIYGGALLGKVHIDGIKTKNTYNHNGLDGFFDYSTTKSIDANFIGGFKLGSWFCKENSNSKTKYFGCYFDFNSSSLDYHSNNPKTLIIYTENSFGPASGNADTKFSSKGFIANTSFLLSMRFRAFPNQQHPFGVLQPYFALGPSFVIIRQKFSIWVQSHIADSNNLAVYLFTDKKISSSKRTFFAAGLIADLGFRYMIHEKIFLDGFFKYCYTKPHITKKINFKPQLHLLNLNLGVGYNF